MKKMLLCFSLIAALCLVGCNNNENNNGDVQNNNNNNSNLTNQSGSQEEENNNPIIQYSSPTTDDFSDKSGFKVELSNSLEGVKYDSVFLINETAAQLDLIFPDNSIGTLLIDSMNSTHIYEPDDATFVGDTKVSIKVGADGIRDYEWVKNNYTFVYSTKTDIKDTNTLTSLVNDVSINVIADNNLNI